VRTAAGSFDVLPFSRYCRFSEALWAIGQNAQLIIPYNSNVPEPNFTKRGCQRSPGIVVIPVVLVFPEILLVFAQRPCEDGGVLNFRSRNGRFGPQICWTDFYGVPSSPLTNDTVNTSFGEDLVKPVQPLLSSRVKKQNGH